MTVRMGLFDFAKQPWVNAISFVVGIGGVGLSIYTYVEARETRELTFYVDPAKALIVKAGQSSKLAVTFDNQPVKTDITVAQAFVWNAGKLPIKKSEVLKGFVITTEGGAPILEATIRSSTRDVVGATIDTTDLSTGRLGTNWNIMERDDGL